MKTVRALLALPLICLLLMGSARVTAPVSPSKSFYVNDYAGILFKEHRDGLAQLAVEVYAQAGIQLVVLTVQDTMGMDMDTYAKEIFQGWEIGGAQENGVLLLVAADSGESRILVGDPLARGLTVQRVEAVQAQYMAPYFAENNFSAGILNACKEIALEVAAVGEGGRLGPGANPDAGGERGGISGGSLILLAMGLVVGLRAVLVSRKYRKKYLFRYDPRKYRHSYARTVPAFDDSPGRATMDPEEMQGIQREGFIIRRVWKEASLGDDKTDE